MNDASRPWEAAIRAGDRRAIARAISATEQGGAAARAIAAAVAPHVGGAHVVGVTGAPGAGKSTLIDALLGEYLARGQRVAVVAIDPSSPITGGAVLGDRVRMGEHGAHANVFIRSLASRGHPGGLSRTTSGVVDVLDGSGFDTIIVETVGAGQSEVEIAKLADTRLVVCPPGLGDSVQAIKAGILEIADLLIVSKGDLPAAETTVRDLEEMLRLRRADAVPVPVLKTAAANRVGIRAVIDAVLAHAANTGRGRRFAATDKGSAATDCRTPTSADIMQLAARDPFVNAVGIRCVDAGPGRAVVALDVGATHVNFNGRCHGGVIFTLADTAFGLASNSHGMIAVGIDAHITYHVAAQAGDTLTATAVEVSRARKVAVYRIEVTRADGMLVAGFTGTVYVLAEPNGVGRGRG
ncbi:MAG TPA: methylmalonyl Co-A mutase-associated GTPase MeaB [Casimicrobiaceae bacterium]|nr:methylmalonyl Co-A mutase-associated GTPase MeaB [Casimicrobiaceae bacterium]